MSPVAAWAAPSSWPSSASSRTRWRQSSGAYKSDTDFELKLSRVQSAGARTQRSADKTGKVTVAKGWTIVSMKDDWKTIFNQSLSDKQQIANKSYETKTNPDSAHSARKYFCLADCRFRAGKNSNYRKEAKHPRHLRRRYRPDQRQCLFD